MLRVLKPAGRIAFAAWSPDGLAPRLMGLAFRYLPPMPGAAPPSPFEWGYAEGVRKYLGERVRDLGFEPAALQLPALSTAHARRLLEETFGPTLPIMRVQDADEAVRQANDSAYGLGASVFTRDIAKGERIARRIEAGAICINDAAVNYLALELPMGGWKASGLGVRHGPAGLKKYTRQQALMVTRFAPKREIHYFPYNARVTKLITRGIKLFYKSRRV